MEKLRQAIKIETKILNKNKPDQFALQRVMKETGVQYEYLLNQQWSTEKPTSKPDGSRVVFDSVDQFRAARDLYFAWRDITSMENEKIKPERPEEIMRRLTFARVMGTTLTLFVPWGVRISGQFGESEKVVMGHIQNLQKRLQTKNIDAQVLFMPADLYATEVNAQVPEAEAAAYFQEASVYAQTQNFLVSPWSEIRSQNAQSYFKRKAELTEDEIGKLLPLTKISEAIGAATRRSGYRDEDNIKKAAYAYLRERICEAEIIDRVYAPIKVSAVAKNKDNDVDRALPRIYILPDTLQFPWLKENDEQYISR